MSTLKSRLDLIFDPKTHSQAALARATGVKPSSVSDWFSGETRSLRVLPLLKAAAYFGVNPLWLASGEGIRTGGSQQSPSAVIPLATQTSLAAEWPFPAISPARYASLSAAEQRQIETFALGVLSASELHRAPKSRGRFAG